MAAAAKKTTPAKAEVVKNDVPDEEFVDTVETLDSQESDNTPAVKPEKVETIEIDVTLANGVDLTIEVVKDQDDWEISAVEAMAEMNYAVLVNSIITRGSKLKLKMMGAKVRDFEMITDKVSGALRTIGDEHNAKKKK